VSSSWASQRMIRRAHMYTADVCPKRERSVAGGRRRVVELEAGSTQRRLLLQGDAKHESLPTYRHEKSDSMKSNDTRSTHISGIADICFYGTMHHYSNMDSNSAYTATVFNRESRHPLGSELY
jgi:hypothetical protein